ncbi:MAG: hypothetical protein ACTSXJ_08105 [Candidatus Baldrarchaeia archaeon]
MIFNATSGYYEKAIKFERAGNYTWFVVAVDGAGNNISSDKMLIEVPEEVLRLSMPHYDLTSSYNTSSVNVRDDIYMKITWLFSHRLNVSISKDVYLLIHVAKWIENETKYGQNFVEGYARYDFSYYYKMGQETLMSVAMINAIWIHDIKVDFYNVSKVSISNVSTAYDGIYPVIRWNTTFHNVTARFGDHVSNVTVHFVTTVVKKEDRIDLKVSFIIDVADFKIYELIDDNYKELEAGESFSIKMIIIHDVVVTKEISPGYFNVTSILPSKQFENGTYVYEYNNRTISTVHLDREFLGINATSYVARQAEVTITQMKNEISYVTVTYEFSNLTYGSTRAIYLDPRYIYYGEFKTIDKNPPTITVPSPQNGSSIGENHVTIKWMARDDETAVDHFCISIDNGP